MTKPDHLLRYAIYARVSTIDQNCEMQLKDLRADRKRRGGTLVDEYVDTGWSGAKRNRPNLNRLLADVAAGKIDAVMVWKIDRFGRNTKNFIDHLDILEKHGVRFVAITQGIDTNDSTGIGHFFLMLLVLFAELERTLIAERTFAGRMRKMTEDKPDVWVLPPLIFGLKDGSPFLRPEGVKLAQQIFAWREMGKSVYTIEDLVAAMGVKGARGGKLGHSSILNLLTSRCMITEYWRGKDTQGNRKCKMYPIKDRNGNLLRVIPDDQFFRVQRMMKEVTAENVGRPSEKLLLRGWVHCHKCGARCVGQMAGKYTLTYRCGKSTNKKRGDYCKGCYLHAKETDRIVWETIWKLLLDPVWLRQLAIAYVAELEKENRGKRDPRKLLKATRSELARIQTGHKAGVYTDAEAALEIRPLREKIDELETEIRSNNVIEIAPLDRIAEACAKLTAGPVPSVLMAQRMVLEQLLNLRIVKRGNELEISGQVPLVEKEALTGPSGIKGLRPKNCPNNLSELDNSFAPIPFRISTRIAA